MADLPSSWDRATCSSSTTPASSPPDSGCARRLAARSRCCCSSAATDGVRGRRSCARRAGSRPGTICLDRRHAPVEIGDDLGEGRRRVNARTAASWPSTTLLDAVRRGAASAVRPREAGRSGALPDGVRPPAGLGRRANCRTPSHGRRARLDAGPRASLVETIELAVGLGTFRPITTARVEDHAMHAERYRVPPKRLAACADAQPGGRGWDHRVRALESAAATGRAEGSTDLFIRRGHRFAVVDALLTNFHVPRSSLLVLVDAFVGPRWRDLYEDALDARLPVPVLRRRDAASSEPTGGSDDPVKLTLDCEAVDEACTGRARARPPRGRFDTPCFMPVGTQGVVKTLTSAGPGAARRRR